MCIQYTDEMLADQEVAFDGTLVSASADGSEAVFEVHRWFKGGEGDQVTLSAEGLLVDESMALLGHRWTSASGTGLRDRRVRVGLRVHPDL